MHDAQKRLNELENMYDTLANNPSWVHPEVSQASFGWMLKEILDLRVVLGVS
ncbi:hypothetical protein HFE03_03655 [Paenibacillus sp. EKM102P]|uniref:hypothetical protein n=1 Tax=unclassified Paenibacillus TaxID=185978 RepID=UPI00142DED6D|nr:MULTISPECIES: hypothetical protein [unclassified Paenibacillus]KAF6618305.1 hypothetical protein HFE00_09490 [Paenibacillus sp. EKM101P]KAF6624651.1 hypothetical protein HFE03_03655 [Paenibacillus sp. EKM102P]KAF6635570.1 hypothetical protein HFE01_01375 [Paenibacillus sp. EKM10P]KAF6648720.1 hypothetical protein HFE02_10175 [Paenibacillus sp. EKM11P]